MSLLSFVTGIMILLVRRNDQAILIRSAGFVLSVAVAALVLG